MCLLLYCEEKITTETKQAEVNLKHMWLLLFCWLSEKSYDAIVDCKELSAANIMDLFTVITTN